MLRTHVVRSLCCALLFLLSGTMLHTLAQNKPAADNAGPVPLIDRELFFNYPDINRPVISPDGKMLAFLKASKGVLNIWVKNIDDPLAKARVLTTSEEPLGEFFWTVDSRYIIFSHNIWDNENYNLYAVDPQEPVDSVTGIPNVRNLTPQDSISTIAYRTSRQNPDLVWVGNNSRDKRWYDLYTFEISTGNLKQVRRNRDSISRWIFDWEENPRIGIRYRSSDSTAEYLRLNRDGSSTRIFDAPVTEIAEPLFFSADNQWIYIQTNHGESRDLTALVRLNLNTMKMEEVEDDPAGKVDLGRAGASEWTHEPLFTVYTDDRPRWYWKDSSFESDFRLLQKKFPGRDIDILSISGDDSLVLFAATADDKLTQVYLLNRVQHQYSLQYTEQAGLRPYEGYFVRMSPLVYQSSDGTSIPAYLSLPRGGNGRNLPVVIIPHDGPWARNYRRFDPIVQWLANRGYAVLQMNFRGSSGYGKKFLQAGNRQWGQLIQDDITWGVSELIGKGVADPQRVGILGANFGGYASLAGLAFTNDIYAAGVAINPSSNLLATLHALPPSWSGRWRLFLSRVGDTTTTSGLNLLRRQSPSGRDSAIRSPLLLVYGSGDPRSTKIDNDHIVVTMRDADRKVDYLVLPGEQYPFINGTDEQAVFAKVESFFGKYLRGRSQESMKPETARRLKEIQTDLANVTVGVAMPVVAMESFPAPTADLAAGNYNYSILVEVPGRRVPLAMNRMIVSDSANNWVVTDRISGQMGDQSDEASYQKGNLRLESRKTEQRGKTAEYNFNGTEITSQLPDKTVNASVEGAYLHDGAGMDLLIARLPLHEGYASGFYMIGDDGKAKLYQVKVTGKDTINSEPCLVVELTNADNTGISTKLWINLNHKMAYRMVVPLAALPGSRMTIALNQQPSIPKFLLFLWIITPAHGY